MTPLSLTFNSRMMNDDAKLSLSSFMLSNSLKDYKSRDYKSRKSRFESRVTEVASKCKDIS